VDISQIAAHIFLRTDFCFRDAIVFFPHFRILAIVRPVDDIPTFCQGESLFYQQQTLGDVSCKASQATSSWVSPCWQQIGSVPVKIRCLDHDQPIVGRSMAHFVMSFNHHKFGGKDVMFFSFKGPSAVSFLRFLSGFHGFPSDFRSVLGAHGPNWAQGELLQAANLYSELQAMARDRLYNVTQPLLSIKKDRAQSKNDKILQPFAPHPKRPDCDQGGGQRGEVLQGHSGATWQLLVGMLWW
jgi:hypothetical protein